MKHSLVGIFFSTWVIGLIIVIPALLPSFHTRLFRTHDYTHVARLAELDRTLTSGALPPRWSKNLGFGYGMPLFSFYAPLPYYFAELIHVVGFDFESSIKIVFAAVTYFSFMAMYGLTAQFTKRGGALVAATLFVYGPYRAVDTYVRGALGELFGILCIVISLWAVTRLVKSMRKRRWLLITSIAIAGLMLSHNAMALIGLPVIFFWGLGLILLERKSVWRDFFLLSASLVLGVGLASYFVIPALFEKQFTSVDELTRGGGSYEQHFVYLRQLVNSRFGYGGSIEGIFDGFSFEIGKMHLGIMLLGLGYLLICKKADKKLLYAASFSFALILISIFLMNARSTIVWNYMPLISYLQFPWRFLSLTLIFTSLFGGITFQLIVQKMKRKRLVLGALLAAIVIYYAPLFKPEYFPDSSSQIYSVSEDCIKREMSKVIPDYIHPKMSHLVLSAEKEIEIPNHRFGISGDSTNMEVLSETPQEFSIKVSGGGIATVSAYIFDFPGWQWWVNGEKVSHSVGSTLPIMNLTLDLVENIPFVVEGKLTETPVRLISNWISLICLGLVGLMGIWDTKKYEN